MLVILFMLGILYKCVYYTTNTPHGLTFNTKHEQQFHEGAHDDEDDRINMVSYAFHGNSVKYLIEILDDKDLELNHKRLCTVNCVWFAFVFGVVCVSLLLLLFSYILFNLSVHLNAPTLITTWNNFISHYHFV